MLKEEKKKITFLLINMSHYSYDHIFHYEQSLLNSTEFHIELYSLIKINSHKHNTVSGKNIHVKNLK